MTDDDIIKYLQQGHGINKIQYDLLKEYYPRFQKYNYNRIPYKTSLDKWLEDFRSIGFEVVETDSWDTNHGLTHQYVLERAGVRVEFNWEESKYPKRKSYSVSYITPYDYTIGIGAPKETLNEDIAAILEKWPAFLEEWQSIEARIPKLQKQLEIGEATIDAVIKNLLRSRNCKYLLSKDAWTTTLIIKMRYGRYVEIKLKPTMNMAKLANFAEMIDTLSEALNTIGSIELVVRQNYRYHINWK